MPSITLNGTSIPLTQQKADAFGKIANVALPQMPKVPLGSILAALLTDAQKQSIGNDHALVQASLWMLHEMGIRAVELDAAAGTMKVTEHIPAKQMARDHTDPFTTGNMATGRAMVIALHNRANRKFQLNGEVIECKPPRLDDMKKTVAGINQLRRVNEDHMAAAARYLGGLTRQEGHRETAAFQCATTLLSDFGICAVRVDAANGILSVEGLNEADAMCGAYLQGATPEQIRVARDRVRKLAQSAKAAGARGAQSTPVHEPDRSENQPGQPGSVAVAFKRRRRD
ncbi:MAG: hypothetical protein O2819_00040 [Planctomycetota bacterium]|nr:hypothetical protein [Planctomycetota bacterium]MDA1105335.1 hypothetical protein [Planctomycetota bacterium]